MLDRPLSLDASLSDLYLDLMKRSLTGWLYSDPDAAPFDDGTRAEGKDWPAIGHTMIGFRRLDNLQACAEDVLANGVPGDMIEAGVWRGGSTILLRAILRAHGVTDRRVWVADSFQGLPQPDVEKYPHDAGDTHHIHQELAVSLERVRANFERYGLLDDQVRFLSGWFRDTLPTAPSGPLALVRLDGDMYESTMDGLVHLYPRLSPGGYLIVDDYGYAAACRQAVQDYRAAHRVVEEIKIVDWTGAYWQKG